jgi:predicted nucleic acid-binding protein
MSTLLDTGPLVAYLNRREHTRHPWAKRVFAQRPAPFYTCEAVLCEAAHLLKREQGGSTRFRAFVDRAALDLSFSYAEQSGRVSDLMETYADTPMDFADACLVALYETQPSEAQVLTTDDDFRVYRTAGGEALDVLMPPA